MIFIPSFDNIGLSTLFFTSFLIVQLAWFVLVDRLYYILINIKDFGSGDSSTDN